MRSFSIDACEAVCKSLDRKPKDHFTLFDSPSELADWGQANATKNQEWTQSSSRNFFGGDTAEMAYKKAREGDLSGVAASDALMTKFERFTFETGRKAWSDDVCGSIPNVPAFIAGHPLAMRRRTRQDSASAPVAIVADLTTSGGISAEQIAKRGAAILALVRILSSRRPVELWAGCMMDANRQDMSAVFCRIETSPLDLATAAYVMTSASFPRRLCYAIARKDGFSGGWPYDSHSTPQKHGAAMIAPAFAHVGQALYVPPIFYSDLATTDPEAWIEARLSELSPIDLAA